MNEDLKKYGKILEEIIVRSHTGEPIALEMRVQSYEAGLKVEELRRTDEYEKTVAGAVRRAWERIKRILEHAR